MYGISKEIHTAFSVLTTPSYGTIKPALKRLEKTGCIKSQKNMSAGGRPSIYYSITQEGKEELVRLILSPPLENPIQFLTLSRIKLLCAEILSDDEFHELCNILKEKAESLYYDVSNIVNQNNITFYSKITFDNLMCEFRNFIYLLEGMNNAGNNK